MAVSGALPGNGCAASRWANQDLETASRWRLNAFDLLARSGALRLNGRRCTVERSIARFRHQNAARCRVGLSWAGCAALRPLAGLGFFLVGFTFSLQPSISVSSSAVIALAAARSVAMSTKSYRRRPLFPDHAPQRRSARCRTGRISRRDAS